jgi:hypothetical protein
MEATMKEIQCRCEAMVEVDVPEFIDLDEPAMITRLAAGESPSAVCQHCGALVRAELPLPVRSSSRHIDLTVMPDIERLSVYRGKVSDSGSQEILLGYQELFERARMLRDELDPRAVEGLKYFLQTKAEESEPEADIAVLYNGLKEGLLEFHITGLKSGQTGVVRLTQSAYRKIVPDTSSASTKEPYKSILAGRYRSIKKLGFMASTEDAS